MRNVFLSGLTTIGIGGRADTVLAPRREEFARTFRRAAAEGRVLVLGRGSKVLCADEGFRGTVLLTRALDGMRIEGETVWAEAGVPLPRLALAAAAAGLSGLEWAVGIPASLGGAVALNAGAYGGAIADVAEEVETLAGVLGAAACGFGYRASVFRRDGGVVTGARLRLASGDPARIAARMEECRAARRASQPGGIRSAGSSFLACNGRGAGWYLERAGCKGARIGDAEVNRLHANFIQNNGGATCQDVLKLLHYMRGRVAETFGIELVQDIIEVR